MEDYDQIVEEIMHCVQQALPELAKLIGGDAAITDAEGIPLYSYNYLGEVNYDIIGKQSLQAKEAVESQTFNTSWSNRVAGARAVRVPIGTKYLLGFNNEAITEKNARLLSRLETAPGAWRYESILGKSAEIAKVKKQVRACARNTSSVMIYGEQGLNKNMYAGVIHHLSPRRDHPLVAVHCAAIPPNSFARVFCGVDPSSPVKSDSEADVGLFEASKEGSLYLDGVDELDLSAQQKLAQILQSGEYTPVGGTTPRHVSSRILCSCRANPNLLCRDGKLLEELFWQCGVEVIHIPPMRYRMDDFPLLLHHNLAEQNRMFGRYVLRVDDEAEQLLRKYHWPGNEAELKSCLERCCNRLDFEAVIQVKHIPEYILEAVGQKPQADGAAQLPLNQQMRDYEKQVIEKALMRNHWSRTDAAKELGINVSTLWRKMTALGIDDLGL